MYGEEKLTMLTLRIPLLAGDEAPKGGDPPRLRKPGQTSPEVRNRDINGPRKRADVFQICF